MHCCVEKSECTKSHLIWSHFHSIYYMYMFLNTYVFVHVHRSIMYLPFDIWLDTGMTLYMRLLNGSCESDNRKGQGKGTWYKREIWIRYSMCDTLRVYILYNLLPASTCTCNLSLNSRGWRSFGMLPLTSLFLNESLLTLLLGLSLSMLQLHRGLWVRGCGKLFWCEAVRNQLLSSIMRTWR